MQLTKCTAAAKSAADSPAANGKKQNTARIILFNMCEIKALSAISAFGYICV